MRLFSPEIQKLELPNAEIDYYPHFFNKVDADTFFEHIIAQTPWQQDDIKVFGKVYQQPRLTALFGESDKPYTYSGITMQPHKFSKELLEIKNKVETIAQATFTSVLLNLYRDGNDSNGWHADNEKELGTNPIIASVSLGESRWFHFKHRNIKEQRHKLLLEHGSLLIMRGEMQHHWLHQIAKTKRKVSPRINLTFRKILSKTY